MLPRLKRLDELYPGYSLYFITCGIHERRALLDNPSAHAAFRSFCELARQHNTTVGRYMIMPDHLHFFVRLDNAEEISAWMKSLKNSLSKTFRHSGHQAPHWQKGYFDHVVRSEKAYEEKWHYVRENPVRKMLVKETDSWPYQGEVNPLTFT